MARRKKSTTLDDWLEWQGMREECMAMAVQAISAQKSLEVLYGTTASLIEGYKNDDSIPDWLMEKVAAFHNEIKTYLYANG